MSRMAADRIPRLDSSSTAFWWAMILGTMLFQNVRLNVSFSGSWSWERMDRAPPGADFMARASSTGGRA